jgi:class 3 adenylate cyclase
VGGEPEQPPPEREAVPFLLYQDEAGAQCVFRLGDDRDVTIGRGEDADVRLWWDPSVSLVHAEAVRLGRHWLISDDGVSRNGTFLNGERVRGRRRLRDGDALRVGRTTLAFNDPPIRPRGATTISDPASASATVTLLFTDLVGSTELMSRLGEDASDRLRRDNFAILRGAAREHGGREVKSLGDGLMLVFASAIGAVSCAAEMQQRVTAHAEEGGEAAAAIRIGLNAGDVITAEDDYFGAAVVAAKRLCDRADSGQILASEIVRSLAAERSPHPFLGIGAISLKGFPDPVSAFEVDWRPAHARPQSQGGRREQM